MPLLYESVRPARLSVPPTGIDGGFLGSIDHEEFDEIARIEILDFAHPDLWLRSDALEGRTLMV